MLDFEFWLHLELLVQFGAWRTWRAGLECFGSHLEPWSCTSCDLEVFEGLWRCLKLIGAFGANLEQFGKVWSISAPISLVSASLRCYRRVCDHLEVFWPFGVHKCIFEGVWCLVVSLGCKSAHEST